MIEIGIHLLYLVLCKVNEYTMHTCIHNAVLNCYMLLQFDNFIVNISKNQLAICVHANAVCASVRARARACMCMRVCTLIVHTLCFLLCFTDNHCTKICY